MTNQQIEAVKNSWEKVAGLDPVVVGGLFYNRLFEAAPQVKPMFNASVPEQSRKLISMIGYVINKLDSLDEIKSEVGKLASRHVKYGVKDEHYAVVGQALLWTLAKGLGQDWTGDLEQAWVRCYTILSEAMINAGTPAKADV